MPKPQEPHRPYLLIVKQGDKEVARFNEVSKYAKKQRMKFIQERFVDAIVHIQYTGK